MTAVSSFLLERVVADRHYDITTLSLFIFENGKCNKKYRILEAECSEMKPEQTGRGPFGLTKKMNTVIVNVGTTLNIYRRKVGI